MNDGMIYFLLDQLVESLNQGNDFVAHRYAKSVLVKKDHIHLYSDNYPKVRIEIDKGTPAYTLKRYMDDDDYGYHAHYDPPEPDYVVPFADPDALDKVMTATWDLLSFRMPK